MSNTAIVTDISEEKKLLNSGRRLRGAIAHTLGRSILAGDYQPGDTLSGELVFAETLGVSRGAYREAVQVLIAKGLVESRTKLGTRVLPRSRWNMLDPDVLAWAFANTPDMQLLRSLFELRAVIEPAAAAFAAERRDRADLKVLKDALMRMRRHTLSTEAGRTADRDFHAAILTASRNDALVTLSAGITAAVEWTTQLKQRDRALPRDPMPEHVAVYDAIVGAQVVEASNAMRRLVDLALDDTRLTLGLSAA
ncbi:DNA-binding FadR family transcriptional regulator [Sphingomonas insulae]|uniref:FadR/GntR family transcriptional regulator n=1 Tax=Sphingomonas insulae TaxID=424800 RepID=A0ABN1HMQ4_9SPHN|nr:FadR/GntR family transcriptional regulator [Sphingomonas insulae]NIJ31595.1 DNA-binding FadR family transcriptional regulator [Sphingomonas insulae]